MCAVQRPARPSRRRGRARPRLDRGPCRSGFDEALDAARRSAPSLEAVARRPILRVEPTLRRFYDLFARTERVVTLYSQGVNQSVSGTDKVNAILNCHLATGRIGRARHGAVLAHRTAQRDGRARGRRPRQPARRAYGFRRRRTSTACAGSGMRPHIATRPGLKAVDMFEAVADGRIKAIWIAATNPADSMPRAGRVREALRDCPLVIVSDAWPTDTTALAHVVLPAAGWAEKDGTVTNSERRISRQRAFRAAAGRCPAGLVDVRASGAAHGLGDAISPMPDPPTSSASTRPCRRSRTTARRVFDIGALAELDDAAYDALAPVQWPCPKPGRRPAGPRLFARRRLPDAGRPRPHGRRSRAAA